MNTFLKLKKHYLKILGTFSLNKWRIYCNYINISLIIFYILETSMEKYKETKN